MQKLMEMLKGSAGILAHATIPNATHCYREISWNSI